MIPPFLQPPQDTPGVDSGNSFTMTPGLPFFMYDGGNAGGTSNPSFDGGFSRSVPVIDICIDGGCA
jgi:hypothetical protein